MCPIQSDLSIHPHTDGKGADYVHLCLGLITQTEIHTKIHPSSPLPCDWLKQGHRKPAGIM